MVWFLLITILTLDYPNHWSSVDRPINTYLTREECVRASADVNSWRIHGTRTDGKQYIIARCEFRRPY